MKSVAEISFERNIETLHLLGEAASKIYLASAVIPQIADPNKLDQLAGLLLKIVGDHQASLSRHLEAARELLSPVRPVFVPAIAFERDDYPSACEGAMMYAFCFQGILEAEYGIWTSKKAVGRRKPSDDEQLTSIMVVSRQRPRLLSDDEASALRRSMLSTWNRDGLPEWVYGVPVDTLNALARRATQEATHWQSIERQRFYHSTVTQPAGRDLASKPVENARLYFPGDLHKEMDVTANTFNKYAIAAGVAIPKTGDRNHMYSDTERLMVVRQFAQTSKVRKQRERAESLLQASKKPQ